MNALLSATTVPLVYLISTVSLFLGLKSVSKVRLMPRSRLFALVALALACGGALLELGSATLPPLLFVVIVGGVGVGVIAGSRVPMAPAPSRMAWIGALAAGAGALVALAVLLDKALPPSNTVAAGLAVLVGGVGFVLGIGVSMRGSISVKATAAAALSATLAGWSVALVGFALENLVLLIGGGVAGMAAIALGRIVAQAAGRSLPRALFAGQTANAGGYSNVRVCGVDEAALVLEHAGIVLVVPGFGMAASQAQHTLKEVAEQLEKRGAKVRYAIHSSAGCVPGHMNAALDEANVPHQKILDVAAAQALVFEADAVLVVGANDTINPVAASDPKSPLYGLGALDLRRARAVFVVKRSLRPGAAGVKNPLFEQANTMVMLGDGKRLMQALVAELKGGGGH